ncbi:DUF6660 family protein [Christiangramia echinicola]|uniref:DUF6660 family protein n=1 Tax=Christiangramia echinicola TaxID=279359 RepID=UPI0004109FDD|nr:DUF6660 family protein [Christiangramia echinicola]
MKFLAVIFSIYFLGLTFVPCEDEVILEDDAIEFHQVDNSHSSNAFADDCSPFCQCHCCHVHITNFENSDTEMICLEISTELPEKIYYLGDDFPQSFFQPPRV